MACLPNVLGSYGFLILYLLLCKTPAPCNTWINTHVFALHPFWIHSAQNVAQARRKPVFWGQQEHPGKNRSELCLRKLQIYPQHILMHSNDASPLPSQKICSENKRCPGTDRQGACLDQPHRFAAMRAGSCHGAVAMGQPPSLLFWVKIYRSPHTELLGKAAGIWFFANTNIIHFDYIYKPTQMSFKGWTLTFAGGKYPHYVLRLFIF